METNLCGLFQCCLLFPRCHRARQGEHNLLSLHGQLGHVRNLDENTGPGRKVTNTDSKHILERERDSKRGRGSGRVRVREREGGERGGSGREREREKKGRERRKGREGEERQMKPALFRSCQ